MLKRFILLIYIILCLFDSSEGQGIQRDMEAVFITTPSPDSSIKIYEKLGFSRMDNPIKDFHGYFMFDGSLPLLLFKDSIPSVGLVFYVKDLEATIAQLAKDGIHCSAGARNIEGVSYSMLSGPDSISIIISSNPKGYKQPASINLVNMKANLYNQEAAYPNPSLGVFGELAIPVKDANSSLSFWNKIGFKVMSKMKMPYPYNILADDLMPIGLHQSNHFNKPTITYFGINTGSRVELLKKKGLSGFVPKNGMNNFVYNTWEGQQIFIFNLGM